MRVNLLFVLQQSLLHDSPYFHFVRILFTANLINDCYLLTQKNTSKINHKNWSTWRVVRNKSSNHWSQIFLICTDTSFLDFFLCLHSGVFRLSIDLQVQTTAGDFPFYKFFVFFGTTNHSLFSVDLTLSHKIINFNLRVQTLSILLISPKQKDPSLVLGILKL